MADDVETEFMVSCPYCGEEVQIYLEPDVLGTLVQDCEVCCQPWKVHVGYEQGERYVRRLARRRVGVKGSTQKRQAKSQKISAPDLMVSRDGTGSSLCG